MNAIFFDMVQFYVVFCTALLCFFPFFEAIKKRQFHIAAIKY